MRYLVVLLLVGCAQQRWYHDTKNEQQFYQDSIQCERFAAETHPGPNWSDASERSDLARRCMYAQGWTQR